MQLQNIVCLKEANVKLSGKEKINRKILMFNKDSPNLYFPNQKKWKQIIRPVSK